jgi:hypothetical protein
MVACGSRVGLRRYCPLLAEAGMTLTEDDAWQQYWLFAVYSWVAVTRRRAWPQGGSRCTSAWLAPTGRPKRAKSSTVSNSWRNCSPKRSGHNSTG